MADYRCHRARTVRNWFNLMATQQRAVPVVVFTTTLLLQACGGGGGNNVNPEDVIPELGAALGSSADTQSEVAGEVESEANTSAGAEVSAGGTSDSAPEPAVAAATPAASASEELPNAGDFFESASTSGFSAQILDDGNVELEWEDQQGARGYNVYRAGEYITTVFENNFQDSGLNDGGHYYEIISFDNNDRFEVVADALTVYIDAPTADVATAGGTLPEHVEEEYSLVFAEEFQAEELDFSVWNTSYLWGKDLVINSEEQYYVDVENESDFGYNPFTLNGETLKIGAIRTPDNLLDAANGQPYLSGVITSYDSFKFTYGYVEARAKVPFGRGLWSAFWLLNAYYVDLKPEIDIMEHIGHDRDVLFHTYHYYDSNGELRSTESMATAGIDFTSEFHTYGVDWRPGKITFYIDGIERHSISDPNVSAQEMYIIANTAIGGWWPGSPDESTVFPAEYEIDYIRAYQKNGVQFDAPLNDGTQTIPLADDRETGSPNHIPSPDQWPEGYPELSLTGVLNDTQETQAVQISVPVEKDFPGRSPNLSPSLEEWPEGFPEK